MTLALVLFLAALQGASELFPISSLGHAVVIPPILGLRVDVGSNEYVALLTLLHVGTAAALFYIYRQDWIQIISGFFRAALRGSFQDDVERLAMMLVVATVPAGLVGVTLQTPLRKLFATPHLAAFFLICNGVVLLGAEVLRRRDERRLGATGRLAQEDAFRTLRDLSFARGVAVGLAQILALLPGISRSGVTMAAGLACGLRHEEALRFSFLLATPIIAAAGLLEVPQLFGNTHLPNYALGAVLAGLTAYLSARFLIRYFRIGRLDPFAGYCVGLGLLGLVVIH